MSVALLTSLVLALVWTSNLGTALIRRGQVADASLQEVTSEEERTRRMMAAEEASLSGGLFGKILKFYERSMRRSLHHPFVMAGFCILLVGASYICYKQLGTDLLPAFDEGGFVVDYVMPPGSSLQETSRVLRHVESILRSCRKSKAPRAVPASNSGWPL